MGWRRLTSVIAGVGLVGACAASTAKAPPSPGQPEAPETAVQLSADEIRKLFSGVTIRREGGGWVWYGYYAPDGSLRGRAEWTGGGQTGTGHWEISEDGLLCREWDNNWGGGGYGCSRIYRYGDQIIQVHARGSAGRFRKSRLTLLQGNPQGL